MLFLVIFVTHFMGTDSWILNRCHLLWAALITICTQFAFISIAIDIGVEPTFLRVFQMLSGSISLRSVGFTDEKTVMALIRRSHVLFGNA